MPMQGIYADLLQNVQSKHSSWQIILYLFNISCILYLINISCNIKLYHVKKSIKIIRNFRNYVKLDLDNCV